MLFSQRELRLWKELKVPSSASAAAAADDDPEDSARLLFMNSLEKAMDVSFLGTMKETVAVIAMYGLRKHVCIYTNHCVCLVGFVLVHNEYTLQTIVNKRSLPMRTQDVSMAFISHTDIILAQKVGISPHLLTHIHVSRMGVHILDQTVARGVYLSDRSVANQLRKWSMQAKSVLHLWIMLRYTLAGFGGTDVALLPDVCLEQVGMSGVPLHGDSSPAYHDVSYMSNLIPCLQAVECTPLSEQYYLDFVRYITDDYVPSMNRLQMIEKQFSKQDHAWERFPVIYTERSRDLWATLSELPSLSLPTVETFLREQFIPKHDELFARTPYDLALDQASVTVQQVEDFCLYRWEAGNENGHVNVHWQCLINRTKHCRKLLASSLDAPSPLLCGNSEVSAFSTFRQPLLMDSSEDMHHVYPFVGASFDLTVMPSVASIMALIVGTGRLSTLMKGQGPLPDKESCLHEVANPLLNISTVVVDVDVEAGSNIISKVRESKADMQQFCSELIENGRKVLCHLETKCSMLEGLADEAKHMLFRTEPGNRGKEGFHHLIVLPEWVCLQNIAVASAFIQLLQITRCCMPMVGEQGVIFDNIYESTRHAMRLPFQCKSKGNHPLLLMHSDYGEAWDASDNIGSLFMHGPKCASVQSGAKARRVARLLIDNISGVDYMSERSEHYRHAVAVLGQRNRLEAKQSSYPSILERFGDNLNCSSLAEIRTLLERAFEKHIAKQLIARMNTMGVGNSMSVADIGFSWLAEKEMMTVGKGNSRYMDVCIAQRHQGLQSCTYYVCVQRKQTGRIHAVLYEMCFSTNCVACNKNVPYYTGIYAVLA
jgi:hypothetical protein